MTTEIHVRDLIKKLAVVTPCYGGQATAQYTVSRDRLMADLQSVGVSASVYMSASESLVHRARGFLTAQVLADPDVSHLLFIDADIGFTTNDVTRMILRDQPIICGIYPKKQLPIAWAINMIVSPTGQVPMWNGLVEIRRAATGFLLIKREVFERWMEEYPETKTVFFPEAADDLQKWSYNFYPTYTGPDGVFLSEDYGFSEYARAMGYRIWMDPEIKLRHVGAYEFLGDPMELFRAPEAPTGDQQAEPLKEAA